MAYRPNLRLGVFLTRVNVHRLENHLRAQPGYAAALEPLLRAFLGCDAGASPARAVALLAELGLGPADLDIRNPIHDPANARLDFSLSYFDGTATVLEYLTTGLLADWSRGRPDRAALYSPRGLLDKYGGPSLRNRTDWPLMRWLDAQSRWVSLPYARTPFTQRVQKREPYVRGYEAQRERLCAALAPQP
jgi:hypothetical protein